MLWDRDTETFINAYLAELREENAAVFIGAGLSKADGFVDWAGLLTPLALDLGLDATKEADLVGVAQFHVNKNANNRHQLSQLLLDTFSDLPSPTDNHAILSRLPIRTYWTTNYDRLVEKALESEGKRVDSKYTSDQLNVTRRGRDVTVYKMHGDIEHPHQATLTRDDYEKYFQSHDRFITALAGDLVSKTFLFLGFSFTDPNLNYVLSRVRVSSGVNQRTHYCLMKRRTKGNGETDEEFRYAALRQELQIQDLMRFNIKTMLVDEYADITEILAVIERRFKLRTIFISGSAAEYGDWGKEKTEHFVSRLAGWIVDQNLRLSTGFGSGIGGAVVSGGLERIYAKKHHDIDDQLVMRPFPIAILGSSREETFKRYREDLISTAGVAIFMMGNKKDGEAVVSASGVRAEYELAKERGLYIVPIGASGYVAQEIWGEVMGGLDKFYPSDTGEIRELLTVLGKKVDDPIELLSPLQSLLSRLAKV